MPATWEQRLTGDFIAEVVTYRIAGQIAVDAEFVAAEMLGDGDVFTATLRADNGSVLVAKQWTASYTITHPNGPECPPLEGCYAANLTPL